MTEVERALSELQVVYELARHPWYSREMLNMDLLTYDEIMSPIKQEFETKVARVMVPVVMKIQP